MIMNNKGQFSIIAALFVVVILVSSVMVTYSAIHYSPAQTQPQIMSALDETNLALKQVLGFTVGYFGSVLQVTGNSTYAYAQSSSYLNSGLENIANMNPEWGTSFSNTALSLATNWFTNDSYSEGTLNVTYDLTGLGITGIAYSVSSALNVQIQPSASKNQVSLTVTQDESEPAVDLSTSNFNFYLYQYSNLTWAMVNPSIAPVSSSNGTYTVDIPSGINPQSYIIQVEDSRGIMVAASSFSQYTGTLTFNTTTINGGNYVTNYDTKIDGVADEGTHGNFTAQQQAPDSSFDTLTEANSGTANQNYNPSSYGLVGSTTLVSGSPGNSMTFGSYGSGSSAQALYTHQSTTTISGTNYYSFLMSGATSSGVTLSAQMSSSRTLLGSAVYSLQGISSIPASTWSFNYRAWKDSVSTVTYDAASSDTSTSGSTFSWPHTVGTGTNRLLVVTISTSIGAGSTNPATVTKVTYGGTQMTQETTNAFISTAHSQDRSYIFYLTNPASGTNTIEAYLSASSNAVGGAVSYSNVNQSTPIQTQNTSENYGSTQSVTVTTTSVGQAVYASLGSNSVSAYTIADDSGQNLRWSQTAQAYKGHGDDEVNPSIGSVTEGWTTGAISAGYACCAIVINPAATAAIGQINANILIRTTTGTVRQTIASDVASSASLTTSASTLSGTYSFPGYTVVSSTDYLEIDYYVSASPTDYTNAYLMIDNSGLTTSQQTSITNVMLPSQYTCEAQLSGTSNLNNWNNILWAIEASSTVGNVNAVFQLYNYASGQYPTSGNGYLTETLGTNLTPYSQTISTNPTQYRDAIGDWTIRLTVTASAPINININPCTFTAGDASYGLSLEEQWTNLNTTALLNPALCIYGGAISSSNLAVDAWYDNSWQPISSGLVSGWNNMSINSYLSAGSTTFTIKFSTAGDTVQNSYQVAAALLRPESDQDLFSSLNSPAATVAVELLQNGTMIWLGQNLQVTTQTIPIPPVPVKAIHMNETINGVNQQVPFQIEDWASSYTVPLGLTNNATVFGNMQMIVFLVNTHVSDFTLWWNGSDQAIQTPLAFTSSYF